MVRSQIRLALLAGVLAGLVPVVGLPAASATTSATPVLLWTSPSAGADVFAPQTLAVAFDHDLAGVSVGLYQQQPDGSWGWLECPGTPARAGYAACQPTRPLPAGAYRLEARAPATDGRTNNTLVDFTVDPTSPSAGTLVAGPVDARHAAGAAFSGTAEPDAVVDVTATDSTGATVTTSATATGGRFSGVLDVRPLADGVLSVTAASAGQPLAVPVPVRKDTVVPGLTAFAATPLGDGTTFTWQASASEPVEAELVVTDTAGVQARSWRPVLPGPDGALVARQDVPGLADGPLALVLRLVDTVGNEEDAPAGTVVKAYRSAIDRAYAAYLAAGVDLGVPLGGEYSDPAFEYGCLPPLAGVQVVTSRTYTHGMIWSSPCTGTHEMHGAIFQAWGRAGGTYGPGIPVTDEVAVAGGGRMSRFARATGLWSAATGAHLVSDAAADAYERSGGAGGYLGLPTSDLLGVLPGPQPVPADMFQQRGARGAAFWRRGAARAVVVHGAVYAAYLRAGGEAALGVPVSDEQDVPGGARMSAFAAAQVYWSPASGATVVRGAILGRYLASGGPAVLGLPLADEERWGGYNGYRTPMRQSRFQRGWVLWSASGGAHALYGAVLSKYLEMFVPDYLGAPTSEEDAVPGGRRMQFESGALYWSPTTGAHEVHGGIEAFYRSLGGPASRLGLPTTDEYNYLLEPRNDFQRGRIRWTTRGPVVTYR